MDAARFDHLARKISSSGTRRGVLRLFSLILPAGVLVLLTGRDDGRARRHGKRRNENGVEADNHKHKNRRRKHRNNSKRNHHHRDKKCKPESLARTCDGQCGDVQNNCRQRVDCGPCDCDSCPACHICDAVSRQCEPDPALIGEDCGNGRICQEDGACICTAASCGSGAICCDGECRACPTPPNSTSACAAGGCFFFCNEGFHRCGDCCVADSSPLTCGDRCTPCPPGEDCDGADCACGDGPSCGEGGVCCGGQCCPAGQLCDGNGNCVAPSSCCSGNATCGALTSDGFLCCLAPQVATCCCESAPGVGDGLIRCCDVTDFACLSLPGCGPLASHAMGGASFECIVGGADAEAGCVTCGDG